MPQLHPGYRPDIDGLRAIAVLAVIAFHVSPLRMPGGFVGVDIFFVISGYLISSIILRGLETGTFTFSDFYARRIRRIFPALTVVLAACLALGWFVLHPDEYESLGKHVIAGAAFVSNFVLLQETGYFDTTAEFKPLLHLWSLGIEEQYYIVWPLLLFLAWKRKAGLPWAIGSIVVFSFALNVWLTASRPAAAFYLPFPRFWELLAGSGLAYLHENSKRQGSFSPIASRLTSRLMLLADSKAALGLLLVVTAIVGLDRDKAFPGWWALLPTLGSVLLISAGPGAWINRSILANRGMVLVGLISYPLYLWHWPLLSFARIVQAGDIDRTLKVAIVVLSFALAWLTYQIVEKRIRFGPRSSGRSILKRNALALSCLMTIVGTLAYSVYEYDGVPSRTRNEQTTRQQAELIRTPYTDEDCKRFVNLDRRIFDYCRYEKSTGSEVVAIIGDSHAHTLFPGLADKFSSRGYSTLLLASSGCPPFVGATAGETAEDQAKCRRKTEQILEIVSTRNDITSVIIVTRGPLWITGKGFGEIERQLRLGVITSTDAGSTAQDGLTTFRTGLERTAQMLIRKGKRVSYFLQVPELGVRPASCIRRPWHLLPRHSCEVPFEVVARRQAAYRSMVTELGKSISGFRVIDPFPILCSSATCRGFEADKLLYFDDNHLSVSGSRYMAQLF